MLCKLIRRTSRPNAAAALSTLVNVETNSKTGVATVTLQRPPVSSINLDLATDLVKAFTDLEKNKSRGMILTSSSPSVFSAGLDILEMYKPDRQRLEHFWSTMQDVWLALYGSSYPTVAAINGHSPAGGCLLACSCEYRVMVRQGKTPYRIGFNETEIGITTPPWIILTYANTLPLRIAESALISSKLFTADEAKSVGLVDELATDKAEAISRAEKWLSIFQNMPPAGRAETKYNCRRKDIQWLKENKKKDVDNFVDGIMSDGCQTAMGIYLDNLKKNQKLKKNN